MSTVTKERPLQGQDESTLRQMLKLEGRQAISPEIRNAYFRVQALRHRKGQGPLGIDSLLLVAHLAGVLPDVFVEPAMPADEGEGDAPFEWNKDDKTVMPGKEMPSGAGMWIGGRNYHVKVDEQWYLLRFRKPNGDGKLVFSPIDKGDDPLVVDPSEVRTQ